MVNSLARFSVVRSMRRYVNEIFVRNGKRKALMYNETIVTNKSASPIYVMSLMESMFIIGHLEFLMVIMHFLMFTFKVYLPVLLFEPRFV